MSSSVGNIVSSVLGGVHFVRSTNVPGGTTITTAGGGRVNINGTEYVGRVVQLNRNRVIVDGKEVGSTDGLPDVSVVVHGRVESINGQFGSVACDEAGTIKTMSGNVTVGGNTGGINTMSGDVKVHGSVQGSVGTMSGDISKVLRQPAAIPKAVPRIEAESSEPAPAAAAAADPTPETSNPAAAASSSSSATPRKAKQAAANTSRKRKVIEVKDESDDEDASDGEFSLPPSKHKRA